MICSAPFVTAHRVPTVLWSLWLEFLNSTMLQIHNFYIAMAHLASPQLGRVLFVAVSS